MNIRKLEKGQGDGSIHKVLDQSLFPSTYKKPGNGET